MPGTPEDFSQLYRSALAEHDPAKKALLLRRVREALDFWAQAYEVQPPARTMSVEQAQKAAEVRIAQGGTYERPLPSVA